MEVWFLGCSGVSTGGQLASAETEYQSHGWQSPLSLRKASRPSLHWQAVKKGEEVGGGGGGGERDSHARIAKDGQRVTRCFQIM